MTGPTHWMVFLGAAVALNLSPGPDLLYVLSKTVAQGTRVGFASAAGLWTGALLHVFAATCGISALLATSARAFTAVKALGAAYLIFLGLQELRSSGGRFELPSNSRREVTLLQAYRQGVLVDVLNPKVAVFFLAFLPQFVRLDQGHPSAQLVVLGTLVVAIAVPIETLCIVSAARTTRFFRRNPKAAVWLDRLLGATLLTLGVRLALASRVP